MEEFVKNYLEEVNSILEKTITKKYLIKQRISQLINDDSLPYKDILEQLEELKLVHETITPLVSLVDTLKKKQNMIINSSDKLE